MTANTLQTCAIPSSRFTVFEGRQLVAEASSVMDRFKPGYHKMIVVISSRTGACVNFMFEKAFEHGGEVVGWRFNVLPGVDEERANGIKDVVIYND